MPRIEVKRSVLVMWASPQRFDYAAAVARLGSVLVLGLAACASSSPRTVPRVVEGRVENGPAVAPYAYEWFIEGERQAAKGRHDEAAIAFETATTATPGDAWLFTRLAEEYEISGATRRADRALAAARRYHSGSARVALAEGRILRSRGEIEGAMAAFSRATELAPTWSDPVIATAETLAARGQPERATAILIEFLEAIRDERAEDARLALAALARRSGDAVTLERALRFDPASSPETRAHDAAELALEAGRPALAARILNDALDDDQNVRLWLAALTQSGERQRAADFLTSPRAARLAPVEDRADLLLDIHAEDRALDLLAAATRSPRVQYSRGSALLARGEYLRAAMTFAEVPHGAASYEASRLGIASCSISKGRRGAAAESLSIAPHASLAVRLGLAEFYVEAGDLRAALRLFDPKKPPERAALASVFERAGRFEEAAAYYASVKVTTASDPWLRARASAEQLASRGLYPGAIAILERWTAEAPDDLYSRVRLVELLRRERRFEEAAAEGRRTLQYVDDPWLRTHLAALLRATPASTR